jgi:hypothetical protein
MRSFDSDHRFRELLRTTLQQAMAPTFALGLLACGDSAAPAPAIVFHNQQCVDGVWNPTTGLQSSPAADYIAYFNSKDGPPLSTGTPCATASPKESCLSIVTSIEARTDVQCSPGGCPTFVVATRGNEVITIRTAAELLNFLGTIETPQQASFLAQMSGYGIACDNAKFGAIAAVPGGFQIQTSRTVSECPIQTTNVLLFVTSTGKLEELSESLQPATGLCAGRRSEATSLQSHCDEPNDLRKFLTLSAELEAASVPAFVKLARELRELNAPPSLINDAVAAARDEVRHARTMGELAQKHGATVTKIQEQKTPIQNLFELAMENAVEGCVRETFGALVAAYQAQTASDTDICAAMTTIADDEARHAALAWRISAWAETRLSEDECAQIAAAKAFAVAALRSEVAGTFSDEVYNQAGWPRPAQAQKMVDALYANLWDAG